MGDYFRGYSSGDTRSLDYGSHVNEVSLAWGSSPSEHELQSELLVYPLIAAIVVPYIIPHTTPFKEIRL